MYHGVTVAVKTFHKGILSAGDVKRLRNEIATLRAINSEYVSKYL